MVRILRMFCLALLTTTVIIAQPNQMKLQPDEERIRITVRSALKAAQEGEALQQYFDNNNTRLHSQFREWAKTHGQIYASGFSDNNGCPGGDGLWLTIYEGQGNAFRQATFSLDQRSYRIKNFFVIYAWGERIDGQVPQRPFTHAEIERDLRFYKTVRYSSKI